MNGTKPGPTTRGGTPFSKALSLYRRRKKRIFAGARFRYERLKQFLMLPACYLKVRALGDSPKAGIKTAYDLLVLFFSYKTFPDHYGLCRLWELGRGEWRYYYGTNYYPPQQNRLRKAIQPFEYSVVFNDKHICVLLCRALGIRTPYTFGVVDPRRDFRAPLRSWLQASPAGTVIIKPLCGEMGRDIAIAARTEQGCVIRSKTGQVPLEEYALREKAIVQEVLRQDSRMAAFSPSSVNTIRVVTLLTRQGEVIIVSAILRAGVGDSIVDNWSAGGIAVGVDCGKGKLRPYGYDKASRRHEVHPTTGVVFNDHPVPEWDSVRKMAADIQRAFSFYRLLGLDMAVDQSGEPVLIEINGAADLVLMEQAAGPLLKSEEVVRAFGEEGLFVNKHQRKLYGALKTEGGS